MFLFCLFNYRLLKKKKLLGSIIYKPKILLDVTALSIRQMFVRNQKNQFLIKINKCINNKYNNSN